MFDLVTCMLVLCLFFPLPGQGYIDISDSGTDTLGRAGLGQSEFDRRKKRK